MKEREGQSKEEESFSLYIQSLAIQLSRVVVMMGTESETNEALGIVQRAEMLGIERKYLQQLQFESFRRLSKRWETVSGIV